MQKDAIEETIVDVDNMGQRKKFPEALTNGYKLTEFFSNHQSLIPNRESTMLSQEIVNEDQNLKLPQDLHLLTAMQQKGIEQQVSEKKKILPSDDSMSDIDYLEMKKTILISNEYQITQICCDSYYEKRIELIKFLQAKYKLFQIVRSYKIQKKRSRYRKNIIKELVSTEVCYVQDITILQEQVSNDNYIKIIVPLMEIINEQSFFKLCQNIKSILTVNQSMLEALLEQFNTYTVYQATMKVVVDYIAYFKLYFDYCFRYEEFQKTIQDYIKNIPKIEEFFNQIKLANTLKGYDIWSYLIKPIQRLPRYVMLFKDLLKHTDVDHPDFKNVSECCDEFSKINTINNHKIGKHLAQLRMFELQRFFPEVQIIHAKNEYIFEEACTLNIDQSEKSGVIYAFSQSLLMTCKEDNVEKVIMNLKLNHLSICKDQGDSQYFHHLISVVGQEETIQFVCSNQESKNKLINDINEIISQLQNIQDHKKNIGLQQESIGQQILVHVIGTEKRNFTKFKKHTIYITEIRVDNVSIKILLRYNQITELEVMVRKKFPKIKIPQFPSMQWLVSHKPKIIEERRILIEQFLQILLCSEMVKKDPVEILTRLSLPLNFYFLTDQEKSLTKSQPLQDLEASSLRLSTTRLIQDNQYKLGLNINKIISSQKKSLKQISNTEILIGSKAQYSGFCLSLHLMTGEELLVGFQKQTRIKELKDEISRHIYLQNSNDFMLFSINNLDVYRLLDEEEIISSHMDCKNSKKDFFGLNVLKNQILSTVFGAKDKLYQVLLQGYFGSSKLEQQDFCDDPIRLKLIVFQGLDEIKNNKYSLTINQYCFCAASFIYLKTDVDEILDLRQHIQQNQGLIEQVIPIQIIKSQTNNSWIQNITNVFQQLIDQISKIQESNRLLNEDKNFQCVVDRKIICLLVILNSIKQNPLCTMAIYLVECPKETIQKLKKLNIEISVNIYIGLNYQGLHLLNPKREILKSLNYNQIQEFRIYTKEITIKLVKQDDNLSFLTQTGQEIKALMEQYRMLNDLNNKIY